MRQPIWREFAHHLLVHFPQSTHRPLWDDFLQFPWRENPEHLRLWQQGETYVKTYLPELAQVPAKFIHRPWALGDLELAGCGVRLGQNYPRPVIEHALGRARALEAFQANKARSGS